MRKNTYLDRIKLPDDAKKDIESGIFFPQNTENAPEIQAKNNAHTLLIRASNSTIILPKQLPFKLVSDIKMLRSFAYILRLKSLYYSSTIINIKSRQAEMAELLQIGLSTWYKLLASWKSSGLVKVTDHLHIAKYELIYKHYEINEQHIRGQRVPNDHNILNRIKAINLRLSIDKQQRKFALKLAITDRCNMAATAAGTSIEKQRAVNFNDIKQTVEHHYLTKRKFKKAVLQHGTNPATIAHWINVNMCAWQAGEQASNNALFTLSCEAAGKIIGRSASQASRIIKDMAAAEIVSVEPTIIQCNAAAYYSRYYDNATPGVWQHRKQNGDVIYLRKLANRLTFN